MRELDSAEFTGTERFLIERRIGAGGFGVVYQAYDRERHARVALKTLKRAQADSLYRFKQEFRSLVDLTHPNLVSLYELISHNQQWFFTMELVDGIDFIEYVRGMPTGQSPPSQDVTVQRLVSPDGINFQKNGEAVTASLEVATTDASHGSGDSPRMLFRNTTGESSVNPERLRAALKQLSTGLIAIHEAGKLHRDIKPSNVLVTAAGRVVLLDFGIVTELSPQGLYQGHEILGTPVYMSPEQIVGQPLSQASDWYSVGVMLYEALIGRPPFIGNFREIMQSKQAVEPLAAGTIVTGLPADLDLLSQQLLRRDPQRRPTGAELLAQLTGSNIASITISGSGAATGNFAGNNTGGSARIRSDSNKTAARRAATPPPVSTALVGRARHMAMLIDAFSAVKAGQAVNVYISGRSGMGKSALTKYFLNQIQQQRNVVVLTGRCYEQESVPYKALDGIIDALSQYLKRLPEHEVEMLLPPDILALARIFPVLQQVKAVTNGARRVLEISDSQLLRRVAFSALRELLTRLTRRVLLVLFIDDLQWGDIDSAVLLGELLRPPMPPPLLVIGCYRSEDAERSPFLRNIRTLRITTPEISSPRDPAAQPIQLNQSDQLQSNQLQSSQLNQSLSYSLDLREIELKELTDTEARELILALLARDPDQPPVAAEYPASEPIAFSERIIETIIKESGGSPLFAHELVRYARLSDNLLQRGVDDLMELTLEEVILFRISQLPVAAHELLKVIAVAGQPLLRGLAREAAGLGDEEETTLALLRAGHLIRARGSRDQAGEVETYHDRIRETVVANLAEESLKQLHRRLAIVLEASGQTDPERLLVHFHAAGDLTGSARYAADAAEQAAAALAFDRAARLYQVAIDTQITIATQLTIATQPTTTVAANGADIAGLQVKLGDALANAGRSVEAAEIYLKAANHNGTAAAGAPKLVNGVSAVNAVNSLELQRRAAEQFLISGHIDKGLAALATVLKMVGMKMPATPRGALCLLLLNRARIRLRGLKYRERRETELSETELIRIDTCWAVAKALSLVDSIRGADFQARNLLLALNAGEPYRIARAFASEAGYNATGGSRSLPRTEMFLHESLALAKRLDNDNAQAVAVLISGIAAFLAGRWRQAHQICIKAEQLLRERCTGSRWEIDSANYYILLSLTLLGGIRELSERTPELIIDARARGDLLAEAQLRMRILYLVYLAADEPAQARREARETIEKWSRQGFYLEHYMFLFAEAEIHLYCGEGQEAWIRVESQWPEVKRSMILMVQQVMFEARYLRARTAIAAMANHNDRGSLSRVAISEARLMAREGAAYGKAKAELIYAGLASLKDQHAEAIRHLALAEAGFETSDMALHAAVARRRRGQLMQNDKGRLLIAAADRWMADEGIKNSTRMADLLAPGNWPNG